MEFEGKVGIVTGGGQGIGQSYCSILLKKGMKVCLCDIQDIPAKQFIASLANEYKDKIVFQKCDVSSMNDFKDAFEKTLQVFGRIDLVINNAGILNEQEWKKTIEINFIGVINGIQLAFQYMGTDKNGAGGHIINTGSNTGFEPFYLGPVYGATKHAVVGLTRNYGSDYYYQKTGVKVCAVCPGPVDTPLYHKTPELACDKEEAEKLLSTLTPSKPEEIAKGLVKVLEDGKNGACLRVDSAGIRYEWRILKAIK